MKKLSFIFACVLGASLLVLMSFIGTATASDRSGRQPQTGGLRKPDGTPASTLININSVAGWIRNDGWSARIPSSGNSGVYYPRGTATAIFQDGIVWGGNVNDGGSQVLRVGGQTYSIGTIGGRIISPGVAPNPNDPDVRIYRIRRDYKTVDLKQDAGEVYEKGLNAVTSGDIATVRAQYETDWNEWPAAQGAPFYNADGVAGYQPKFNADGSPKLRPAAGETFDPAKHADEPGVADADQVVWFVCNDLNAGRTLALYGSNPIGLELQVTLWGYNRTDPLANVYFKKFTFIYKGTTTTPANATITDMYVGQWSDPDMGDAGDDFAGCDVGKSLVYVYNSKADDSQYAKFGLKPPAVGYDFLQGPLIRTNNPADTTAIFGLKKKGPGYKNLPMTAAFYFAAGSPITDPPFNYEGARQWYNLLRGLIPISGAPFVHPTVPGATTFWLDGDPVAGTGRLDGAISGPGDRRIGACSGPFRMAVGDTQEVVVGVVAGIGSDRLKSITAMKNNDIAVQNAYNDLFDLPKAPPSPKVKGIALDKQIVLNWGSDIAAVSASEGFNKKGYAFEGYNVYQLPSPSASFSQAIRLATYDLDGNGVRTIIDTDSNTVLVVLQRGTDSGVKRELVINTDAVRSLPIVNGQYYYFAVTSYGYNPDPTALTHALESSIQVITVVPQTPDPGAKLYTTYGEKPSVTNTNPGKKSDGVIVTSVVDPTKVTGQPYKIVFKNIPTTFPYAAGDVTVPWLNWFLVRGGRDTVARGVNQGPTAFKEPGDGHDIGPINGNDFDYPIADGMFVTTKGPAPLLNEDRSGWTGTRWWTGTGRFTGGGPGADVLRDQATTAFDMTNYLGAVSTTLDPSQYVDVEMRFGAGGSLTQKAYRYRRAGTYNYQDYVDVPFQVWDVSVNPARQLNCAWRDQNADGAWTPGAGAPNLEVIFIAKSTYDGNTTPSTYGTNVGLPTNNLVNKDVMFVAEWVSATGLVANITATTIKISPNYVNSAADVFAFNAPAAPTYDAKAAKADVSQINAFPNPYYGFNRAETSRQTRFVTFNHLPPRAEIRIFNLAGALVKAFEKNDPSQYINWNMQNQNDLPVASGVYIVYISMPDLGATKTLKLIVVQEQQFLENF